MKTRDRSRRPSALRRASEVAALACIASMGPGYVASTPGKDADACRMRVQTRLYFGSRMPDGSHIGAAQWHRFFDAHIAPAAAEGYTLITGEGGWRGSGVMERETTRVLEIVHAPDPAQERRWREVAAAYRAHFRQQSVLHTRQIVAVCD